MSISIKIQNFIISTLTLLTLTTVPAFLDPYNFPKLYVLVICAGIILTYLILNFNLIINLNIKLILIFTSLFTVLLLTSTVTSDQSLYKTLIGAIYRNNGVFAYVSVIIIFFTIAINKSIKFINQLILCFGYLGFLLICIGLYQRSEASLISPAAAAVSVKLTLGNIDYAAALLGLTGIATLFLFLNSRALWFNRVLFLISFYCHYILLFDSPAIQGRVIFVAGSLLVFGFWLSTNSKNILKKFGIIFWSLTLVMGIFTVGALLRLGPLKTMFGNDIRSLTDRYYQWLAAIEMIKDKPFFGVGMDAFGDWHRRYNSPEGFNRIVLGGGAPIDNPHNLFLHLGATGGLTLLIGYLALTGFILYRGLLSLKRSPDPFLAGCLFSIWLLFQAQSMISIDQIGLSCWAWAVAGCIVSLSYLSPTKDNKNLPQLSKNNDKKPTKLVLGVSIICQLPLIYMVPILIDHIELGNRVDALRITTEQAKVKQNTDLLLKSSLRSKEPYFRANIVRLMAQFNQLDSARDLAIDSTKRFPSDYESWNTLAKFYEATGQKSLAIEPRRKSIELDPMNLDLKKILEDNIKG